MAFPAQATLARSGYLLDTQAMSLNGFATQAITGTIEQVEPEPTEPPPTARVFVEPDRVQVFAGHTELTSIGVETDAAVFQIALQLAFDPQIVAVVDASPEEDGVQIELNPTLVEQGITVVDNEVNNESGLIELALQKSWPDMPIEVNAGLATITWLGLNEGIAEVTLAEATLADENGRSIYYEAQGGTIEVTAVQENQLFGRVFLQGRLKHNGTNIYVSEQTCENLIQNKSITLPNSPVTTTDLAGYFFIEDTANKTFRCLLAVQRGYLSGVQSFPKSNLGTLTLPGGDISGDNVVDIFDIAYIGSHYGDNNRLVDINGDGVVSIFDLVITASNYGLRGPVRW